MEKKKFRDLFCERFRAAPGDYEERVMWECFYPHTVRVGQFLWRRKKEWFERDANFARAVADCPDMNEFRRAMGKFTYYNPIEGVLQKTFNIRISGQRLVNLGARTFNGNGTTGPQK